MEFGIDKHAMSKVLDNLADGEFGSVTPFEYDITSLLDAAWETACSHSEKRTWSLLEGSSLVIDGRSVVSELRELLPARSDNNINEYIDRIRLSRQASSGELEACLYISNLEDISPHFSRLVTDIGELLLSHDNSFNSITVDFFMTNMSKTPFGVHKDTSSNITFILEGEKHFRVWPNDALPVEYGLRLRRARPLLFDYHKHLDLSSEIVAHQGSVVYWPSDCWHIAEGKNSWAATVVLGVV